MSDDPFEKAIASFRQMAADAASARAMRELASSMSIREVPSAEASPQPPSNPAEDLKRFQQRLRDEALAEFNAKRRRT